MNNETNRIARTPSYLESSEDGPRVRPANTELKALKSLVEESASPKPVPAPTRYLDAIRPREPSRISVQIATGPELMETVYRLRHDSYVAQGFLEPKISGLFSDEWDRLPHFFSMLAFVDGKAAASVRISHCRPAGAPSEPAETTAMDLFKTEILNLAESFRVGADPAVVMEMSRLTRHPDFSEGNSDPLFGIFRANFYCLIKTKADILISAVRRHHMPFYRRLGFQKITEPRPYPKLKFETALMACFRHSYETIQNSIPIFQGIAENDSVFSRLFAGERVQIFDEMPAREIARRRVL